MASKRGGQKELDEYCSPDISGPSEAVEGALVKAPTHSASGEGRCSTGRNGYVHGRSDRGRGSGIYGKYLRDNDGKVLLPAGMTTTGKDRSYKPKAKGRRRI